MKEDEASERQRERGTARPCTVSKVAVRVGNGVRIGSDFSNSRVLWFMEYRLYGPSR
ncbi:unnamed protein product [Camellia sinensis]